jgi:RHS repeat-associated protein
MNKTLRLKSALLVGLVVLSLVAPGAFGKVRHNALASAVANTTPLVGSAKTLLPDGRILFSGGQDSSGRPQSTLLTQDPVTGVVTALRVGLRFPRAAHTATVLPDGTVLILGGIGRGGAVVSLAELFEPAANSVTSLVTPSPAVRAFHTATLLTDGRVLFAGGVFANSVAANMIELWDPRGLNSAVLSSVAIARRGHNATLLPDGRVLFTGGQDANANPLTQAQIFDPQSQTVAITANPQALQESDSGLTEMRASSPLDGAQNVSLNALISVRFSRPVQMPSISGTTLTLQGPEGIVSAKAIAAEGGMLAFVTPAAPLLASTNYTVDLAGAVDTTDQSVAYAEFAFTTAGGVPASSDGEEWTPTSDWQTHRGPTNSESLPDLQGPHGATALAGQVLKLNGEPLEHVTLEIGNRRAQSDSTGRFLLTDIPAGHQVLIIEGATANTVGKKYGRFEFGDEIKAGVTNKLDFKIWMSLLDMAHEITIPSPTTKETVLTTPTMPGLELHLQPGTVITDASGKVVTKITITPIPLDRPPFPLPFVVVPTYFTIQPGGAYISVKGSGPKGARLFYPNTEHEPAGVPYAFWDYNADHNGWFVYGRGRVNQARTQVIPDPGVVIYDFSGAMVGSNGPGPTQQPIPGPKAADPVDLSSGLFIYNKTDLFLSDVIPISFTRTYRQNDSWSRPFGIGATHNYEMFIGGNGQLFSVTPYVDLILADGTRIHFVAVGSAPPYQTYLNSSAGTPWYGATISAAPINPNNYNLPGVWQIQSKDGTIYSFPGSEGLDNPGCQALVGITDRHGNQVTIARNTDANCTIAQITSPSGRYIQFTYDSSLRVKTATDNIGRQVQYTYDASGRLYQVTDANSGLWTYNYDTLNRMTTIEDPRSITYLTNTYTGAGMVYQQFLADQTSYYQFNWTTTSNTQNTVFAYASGSGGPAPYQVLNFRSCTTCNEGFQTPLVSQVQVVDPRGYTRQVVFNQNGFPTSDTLALGKPEQETTTYTYFADNLINTVTDQLDRITTYNFDVNANPTSITSSNGTQFSGTPYSITASASYDSMFSNPLTVTDPLGNTTSINYDTYGNATSVTDPLGHQTTFGYNGLGLMTSMTDAMQDTTQFIYNLADLIGITDPLQNATTIFNDGVGRLVQRTDPLGNTTKYQYNNLNQLTQIMDALLGVTTLTYDLNGNLHTVLDARQQGTNNYTLYSYDNFDHLQTRKDPLQRQENYVFDQLGNLTSFTDRRGKVSNYQYDGINRRTFAGYGFVSPNYESTVNYYYDGGNRLNKVVDSTSGTITPVFDGLDRLVTETTPQGVVNYTYDNDSRLQTATVSGQPTVDYYFDNASRLYQVTQGSTNTLIGYDNANRRNSLTLPNGILLTYGYDNDSRVTGMTYTLGTTTAVGSLTYQYDAAGRRTQIGGSLAATGFPQAMTLAAYDAANELSNWNGTTITPDANGNVLNDGVAAYTWNARNQLISRGSTNFQYDSYGRRTLNAAGNNLLYEGWNAAQELSGTTPTANRSLGGIDEFFTRTDTTGAYSPITDALGSSLALTNSSGNITTQYGYDPFGNASSNGGTSTNVFQYTGRENDGNGLYFYRARYYSPTFGRFISEDPIGFGDGPNVYSYVHNSPLNLRDPFGLSTSSAALCFLKGAANGAAAAVIVGGVAAVAVTVGAPVAAVTGIVLVAGVAGGVATGWDIYSQTGVGNWNRVAYDVGSVAGGAAAGATIAPVIGPGIAGGETTPGWSLSKDWGNRFDPFYPGGSVWNWLGKGPDNAAAGGAAAAAGSGAAMAGRNCGCN